MQSWCEIHWLMQTRQALLELTNMVYVLTHTTKIEKGAEYEFVSF